MRLVFIAVGDERAGIAELSAMAGAVRVLGVTRLLGSPASFALGIASALSEDLAVNAAEEAALADPDMGPPSQSKAAAAVAADWLEGNLSTAAEGGETGLDLVDRLSGLFKRLRAESGPDETVLLVSHEVALRTALPRLLTGLSTTIAQVGLGAADLVVAELVNRRFVARRWGRVEIEN